MCGPSAQEQNLTDEQANFYSTLTNEYSTVFGENQQITGALTSAMTPILTAGPSQTGFSPGEVNALTTQNVQGTATAYANAQRATAGILAARGGGNDYLPSSVNANLLAQNANAAAATQSTNQLGITNANYQQGYQNWQTAASVLGSTASLLNPTNYASAATTAGQNAFSSAQTMVNQSFAPWSAAIGALGSIGGAAVTGGLNYAALSGLAASQVPTTPVSMYNAIR